MINNWTKEKIREWVFSQNWYQTIHILDDIITPGNFVSDRRIQLMNLGDLSGKTVLDVGCNSGQLCFEAKKRGASRVVGIDIFEKRLEQAKTIAQIKNMDIVFKKMDILESINLEQFDFVFCISVLTEIPNLISSLLTLKKITKEILFLELIIAPLRNLPRTISKAKKVRKIEGRCYLRKVKGGRWSLLPNIQFIKSLIGDKFSIKNMGKSSRYYLLRCEVRK